jgi:hypothetical protein
MRLHYKGKVVNAVYGNKIAVYSENHTKHKNTVCVDNAVNEVKSVGTYKYAMLGGSLVTTAWRVLRLRMEETPSSFGGYLRIC